MAVMKNTLVANQVMMERAQVIVDVIG